MTRTQLNVLEQFMVRFDALKQAASNEPSRVTTFFNQHEPLRKAVTELFELTSLSDFERRIFHTPKKYHVQAPEGFQQAYEDYEEHWQSEIWACIYPFLLEFLNIDVDPSASPVAGTGAKTEVYTPDPNAEDGFDPLHHDGGAAFEMALWAAETLAQYADGEHGVSSDYAAKIGLEAYEYLVGTIGLDVKGAFRRWRNIPIIFMPAHVSNAHGLTEKGSLYDLLDDAVRAHVFGAPAAAIATCRAALEMVLKRHYGLDYQFRDRDGRVRDKGLGELIVLANEKFSFVQGRRLQRLCDDANRVMHNYSQRDRDKFKDEQVVLEFLKTIKFLIEKAPDQ